jgi:muramoyltetrapeptide carboxypeptidase
MTTQLLSPLQPGDIVEFISLSNSTDTTEITANIEKGTEYYKELGFEVQIKQDFSINFKAAADTAKNRALALHNAVSDESVKLVQPIRGGARFNQLLYEIDYDLIQNNPKWYGGFSDTSALINLVTGKTSIPTIHGLDVAWHISEYESFPDYIMEQHKSAICDPYNFSFKLGADYEIKDFEGKTLKSNYISNNISFSGKLMGGHLGSTPALLGHKCFENENLILLLETTTGNEHTLKELYGLLELGLFKNVNGVMLGFSELDEENFTGETPIDNLSLFEVMEEILNCANKKYDKEIGLVKTNMLGHGVPNILFPLGLDMDFDSDSGVLKAV